MKGLAPLGLPDRNPSYLEPIHSTHFAVRSEDDPREVRDRGEGLINVIDLANVWSCAFIATDDVGVLRPDGTFTVAGRVDHSDVRGCSLLVVS